MEARDDVVVALFKRARRAYFMPCLTPKKHWPTEGMMQPGSERPYLKRASLPAFLQNEKEVRSILTQSGNKKKGSYLSLQALLAYFFSILKRSGGIASKKCR